MNNNDIKYPARYPRVMQWKSDPQTMPQIISPDGFLVNTLMAFKKQPKPYDKKNTPKAP